MNLKYKDGRSMTEHPSNFLNLVNQLATMGMKIGDEIQALLLLGSLPDSWETLVISLSNSVPKLTMDIVKDNLLNEKARRKEKGESSSSSSSSAYVNEKQEVCGKSNTRAPHGNGKKDPQRGRSKSRSNIKCYYYNKVGQVQRECRAWKRE